MRETSKKGIFVGKSHREGGIPSKVVQTGQLLEIEGREYYICQEAYNSTKQYNFKSKTNKQILDEMYTDFSCKLIQSEMSVGDFIVCKVVVKDQTKRDRSGTISEILNQMQAEKSCKVENRNSVLKDGGKVSSTEIQTLILNKSRFKNEAQAKDWVQHHDFNVSKTDEKEETYRFRQSDPKDYSEDSFRTITISRGVKAVIAVPVQQKEEGGKIEERYVAEADFYVYAHSDEEAEQKARELSSRIDVETDNNMTINHLHEVGYDFGHSRKIFNKGGLAGFDSDQTTEDMEESTKVLRNAPRTLEELKESLEYLQENQVADVLFYSVQESYFNEVISEDPLLLTAFLELQNELNLKRKQTYDYYMMLSEVDVKTEFQQTFLENLHNSGKTLYDLSPKTAKSINLPKKLSISPRPDNANLSKITDKFVGYDDLRPIMMGVYFDLENQNVVCTNAHIMLIIDEKPDVVKPTVCLMGKSRKKAVKTIENFGLEESEQEKLLKSKVNADGCWEVEGTFPAYLRVIPADFQNVVKFEAKHLLSYIKAGLKDYTNHTTERLTLFFRGEDNAKTYVGFSGTNMKKVIESMLLLGHEKLEICFTSSPRVKAMIVVPEGNSRKVGYNSIDTDMALIMPVHIDLGSATEVPDYQPTYNLIQNIITPFSNPERESDQEYIPQDDSDKLKAEAEKHLSTLRSIFSDNFYSKSGFKVTNNLKWDLKDNPYLLIEKSSLNGKYQLDISVKHETSLQGDISQFYYDVRFSLWLDNGFVNPILYIDEWQDNDLISDEIYTLLTSMIDGDHISHTIDINEPKQARTVFNNFFKYAKASIAHDDKMTKATSKKSAPASDEEIRKIVGRNKDAFKIVRQGLDSEYGDIKLFDEILDNINRVDGLYGNYDTIHYSEAFQASGLDFDNLEGISEANVLRLKQILPDYIVDKIESSSNEAPYYWELTKEEKLKIDPTEGEISDFIKNARPNRYVDGTGGYIYDIKRRNEDDLTHVKIDIQKPRRSSARNKTWFIYISVCEVDKTASCKQKERLSFDTLKESKAYVAKIYHYELSGHRTMYSPELTEDYSDVIEGLEILSKTSSKKDKIDIENTIKGLSLLSVPKMATGGIVTTGYQFTPIKTPLN